MSAASGAAISLLIAWTASVDALCHPSLAARALPCLAERNVAATAHQSRERSVITMFEYSTKVKMTAETRAPFRQARIFFLYPATIAGASIATYVSILRLVGGKDALADSGNLIINIGIIVAAIFGVRTDLKGRSELLQEVAIELGEAQPQTADSAAAEAGGETILTEPDDSAKKKKKKKRSAK